MREIFFFQSKTFDERKIENSRFLSFVYNRKNIFTEVFYLSCIVFIEVFLTFLYNLIAFLKIFNMKIF